MARCRLAIPLGLIASELLTNALRHAFPPDTAGEVKLAAAVKEGMLQMTIIDDGVGLPETPVRRGLGTTVMTALTKQIGETLSIPKSIWTGNNGDDLFGTADGL